MHISIKRIYVVKRIHISNKYTWKCEAQAREKLKTRSPQVVIPSLRPTVAMHTTSVVKSGSYIMPL